MAAIASTTAAARSTWCRSCLPPIVIVSRWPSSCRHSTGCGMVTTGWNATLNSIGIPLLMPPCIPPQWLVFVLPSLFQRSMYSLPFIFAAAKPAPISKPMADGMLIMAAANAAPSLPKSGSPTPAGTPVMLHRTTPPIVSFSTSHIGLDTSHFMLTSGISCRAMAPATTRATVSRADARPPPR